MTEFFRLKHIQEYGYRRIPMIRPAISSPPPMHHFYQRVMSLEGEVCSTSFTNSLNPANNDKISFMTRNSSQSFEFAVVLR